MERRSTSRAVDSAPARRSPRGWKSERLGLREEPLTRRFRTAVGGGAPRFLPVSGFVSFLNCFRDQNTALAQSPRNAPATVAFAFEDFKTVCEEVAPLTPRSEGRVPAV